jgi:CO/xanthine dehydrogenase FAD-binding subunit
MIIEYHRPVSVEHVIALISRNDPPTFPLGGGTVLSQPSLEKMAVVDLQDLGMDYLDLKPGSLVIGSTSTLQTLLNQLNLYPALKSAIRHEATYNIRQIATIAGTLVAADGRSPFATVMLALGAQITLMPDEKEISLGEFFPFRKSKFKGNLITRIAIPTDLRLSYEYVARTPADQPIVCVSLVRWQSGRTRVALGGYGSHPIIVFDGPNAIGADAAAEDAYSEARDQWASAAYRSNVAAVLVRRCLGELNS